MKFTAEMYASDGLYGYFFKFICEEFAKIVKDENPQLWKFVNDNGIGVKVKESYTSEEIAYDVKLHKGHLRKDTMRKMLRDWRDKEENSGYAVVTTWLFKDDKMYIGEFILRISAPALCMRICRNIYDIDNFKEEILWSLHHEVGHMIDYMNNRHGSTFKEWQAIEDRDKYEYDKYYDETQEPCTSLEKQNEYNMRYYRIPQEQAANDAIGISVRDMIKRDKEWHDKYSHKLITVSIEQISTRDIPPKPVKEEENK